MEGREQLGGVGSPTICVTAMAPLLFELSLWPCSLSFVLSGNYSVVMVVVHAFNQRHVGLYEFEEIKGTILLKTKWLLEEHFFKMALFVCRGGWWVSAQVCAHAYTHRRQKKTGNVLLCFYLVLLGENLSLSLELTTFQLSWLAKSTPQPPACVLVCAVCMRVPDLNLGCHA